LQYCKLIHERLEHRLRLFLVLLSELSGGASCIAFVRNFRFLRRGVVVGSCHAFGRGEKCFVLTLLRG
jgi:hypothetical protein